MSDDDDDAKLKSSWDYSVEVISCRKQLNAAVYGNQHSMSLIFLESHQNIVGENEKNFKTSKKHLNFSKQFIWDNAMQPNNIFFGAYFPMLNLLLQAQFSILVIFL